MSSSINYLSSTIIETQSVSALPQERENAIKALLENYEVVYSRPGFDLSQAEYFFIGEKHSCPHCKNLNSQFITEICKQSNLPPIAFIEGLPSMQESKENQIVHVKEIFKLTHISNIRLFGWDASTEVLDRLGIDKATEFLLLNQIKFFENALINTLNQQKTIFKEHEKLVSIPEATLWELDLEKLKEYSAYVEHYENLSSKLEKQITNLQTKIQDLETQLKQGLEKVGQDAVKETYPARTHAMVQTVQTIKELQSQNAFKGPIFFICGAEHLKTAKKNKDIKEFQLDTLYQELQSHNAVILIPKTCADY